MKPNAALYSLLMTTLVLALSACGDDSTEVAEECASQISQVACPAGTAPQLSAGASDSCSASGSLEMDILGPNGEVQGQCKAQGSCTFACLELQSLDCACGLERVTRDEYICRVDCPSVCGDGLLQSPNEECDLGEVNGTGAGCSSTCQIASDACSPNGDRMCITPTRVLECVDALWRPAEDCSESGLMCAEGECGEPPVACSPNGAADCDGNIVRTCVDGAWQNANNCADTGQTCSAGSCAGEAACQADPVAGHTPDRLCFQEEYCACGGDPTGTWRFVGGCEDHGPYPDGCTDVTIDSEDGTNTGTVTLTADEITFDLVYQDNYTVSWVDACGDCASFSYSSDEEDYTCASQNGRCVCTFAQLEETVFEGTLPYTSTESTITFDSTTFSFCVTGDTLELLEADEDGIEHITLERVE